MHEIIERLEARILRLEQLLTRHQPAQPTSASVSGSAPPAGAFQRYKKTAEDILATHTFGMKF